ncbi:MAG: hypothetical protein ACR2FM_01750 [Candidatus Saccharimonadales bacterium]
MNVNIDHLNPELVYREDVDSVTRFSDKHYLESHHFQAKGLRVCALAEMNIADTSEALAVKIARLGLSNSEITAVGCLDLTADERGILIIARQQELVQESRFSKVIKKLLSPFRK